MLWSYDKTPTVNLVLPQQWQIYSWMNQSECTRHSNTHLSVQNLPVSHTFKCTFGVRMSTLADGAICSRLITWASPLCRGCVDPQILVQTSFFLSQLIWWTKESSWVGAYRHSVLGKVVVIPPLQSGQQIQATGTDLMFWSWGGTSGNFPHIWKSQCCKRGRWEYPKGIDAILNYMSAVDETSPELPISQQWSQTREPWSLAETADLTFRWLKLNWLNPSLRDRSTCAKTLLHMQVL